MPCCLSPPSNPPSRASPPRSLTEAKSFDPPPQPAPAGAGLLHISKELEEEGLAPSSELHFAPDGFFGGVVAQNVESYSTNDTKILWRVILARSRVIFVEDNVELPMQVIFHTPMRPRDFENPHGREPLGE